MPGAHADGAARSATSQASSARLRLKPRGRRATRSSSTCASDNDLARSHLLHRLAPARRPLGRAGDARRRDAARSTRCGSCSGSRSSPCALIEAAAAGTTVERAADRARSRERARRRPTWPSSTALVEAALLAELPTPSPGLMRRVRGARRASTPTSPSLMDALPPLARVARYGNVRETDAEAVGACVDGLVARICVGLPAALRVARRRRRRRDGATHRRRPRRARTARRRRPARRPGAPRSARLAGRAGAARRSSPAAPPAAARRRPSSTRERGRAAGMALGAVARRRRRRRRGLARGLPRPAAALVLMHDDALLGAARRLGRRGRRRALRRPSLPLLRRTFSTFAAGRAAPDRRARRQRARRGAGARSADDGARPRRARGAVLPGAAAAPAGSSDELTTSGCARWRLVPRRRRADGTGAGLERPTARRMRPARSARSTTATSGATRSGGSARSAPNVARWLGDIRELLPDARSCR